MFYNCITGECESCNSLNCNSFFHYYFLLLVGSGYGFQLDSTCYNITYQTSNATVPRGTYLFSFTVFIEEGTTEPLDFLRSTQIIAFSGPSESAITIFFASGENYTFDVNAGEDLNADELTYGTYYTDIRSTFIPPINIISYPVTIQIIGKLCLF